MLIRHLGFILLLMVIAVNVRAQKGESNDTICSNSILDQSVESSKFRRAKNFRYNSSGQDLTTREPNQDYFVETITSHGLPIIPSSESSNVVVGKVIKIQPYFSGDKSQIYTEITLQVEEVLKNQSNSFSNRKKIILNKIGGAVRVNSGKVIRYEIQTDGQGNPCDGSRYIFFIKELNSSNDLYFIRAYELKDGKVFTLDNSKKKLINEKYQVSPELSNERTFLKFVRREIEKDEPR